MSNQNTNIAANLILFCSIISVACGLTLQDYTTRKPRITKWMTTTKDPRDADPNEEVPVVVPKKDQPYYRVKNREGSTCILMTSDAIIEIKFKSNIGDEQIDTFIPDKPTVTGDCQYEDTAVMTIAWAGYTLRWDFSKTPGGDRWYVDNLRLTAATEQKHHHSIGQHGSTFKLTQPNMIFPTPIGRSYSCPESQVTLTSHKADGGPQNVTGILLLRNFQMQPFMYRSDNFDDGFECSSMGRSYRDETAPIAVGSSLAIAVLGIITGYGAFRYFKIKKVQYNTME